MEKVSLGVGFFHILCYNMENPSERSDTEMEQNIFPVLLGTGRAARQAAMRIYLQYGLRAEVFGHTATVRDRVFGLWRKHFFSGSFPDALLVTALIEAARAAAEYERIPLLYLCNEAYLPLLCRYQGALEAVFIICDTHGSPLGLQEEDSTMPHAYHSTEQTEEVQA